MNDSRIPDVLASVLQDLADHIKDNVVGDDRAADLLREVIAGGPLTFATPKTLALVKSQTEVVRRRLDRLQTDRDSAQAEYESLLDWNNRLTPKG